LASLLRDTDRLEEAGAVLGSAYDRLRAESTDTSPIAVDIGSSYAVVLAELGKPEEADPIFEFVVAGMREMFREAHPKLGSALSSWGRGRLLLGDAVGAEPLLLEAHEMLVSLNKSEDAATAAMRLAEVYRELDRPEERSLWLTQSGLPVSE